jgi:hypothetical protein
MKREDLEHIIRASGDVLGESEVIIVRSQAILGAPYEGLPKDVTLSVEVDVMATHDPDGSKALRLNGAADASVIAGCPSTPVPTRATRGQLPASHLHPGPKRLCWSCTPVGDGDGPPSIKEVSVSRADSLPSIM